MIHCGDPNFGYIEYGCMHCGGHRHRVGMTCKSSLCLSCSRVKSEKFVYNVMNKLYPGIIYRHLILTIPDQLIPFFYKHRHGKELFNRFYQVGFEYIQDVFRTVSNLSSAFSVRPTKEVRHSDVL
jgi:excinuclease UvrABC ATPase subunit